MGIVAVVQFLSPFITLFLGYILLGEKFKILELVNMIVAFIGVMIIVLA